MCNDASMRPFHDGHLLSLDTPQTAFVTHILMKMTDNDSPYDGHREHHIFTKNHKEGEV